MQLNQTNLRGILAAILSVDESYIVPKQANWWNPQQDGEKKLWCAYRIKSNEARTPPFFREIDGKNCVCVLKLAKIELQFVGEKSEEVAQSVAMWSLRNDVKSEFEKVHGSILYENLSAFSTDFFQDGLNSVIAWNISDLRVLWYDILETNLSKLTDVELHGSIL